MFFFKLLISEVLEEKWAQHTEPFQIASKVVAGCQERRIVSGAGVKETPTTTSKQHIISILCKAVAIFYKYMVMFFSSFKVIVNIVVYLLLSSVLFYQY